MKSVYYLIVIMVISVLLSSCRTDEDVEYVIPPNMPTVQKVVGSIHGNVTDDEGNRVSGAMVTFENESVETDENGVFQFQNKKMNKNGTFVSVDKEGYFNGSRRLYPSAGVTSFVTVELITLKETGSFNSQSKSTITHDRVTLNFPNDAIVQEDGSNYNGEVHVAVAYLDPTNEATLDQMPGDLTGISNNGNLAALKSLGMIAVELMDDSGNELQVKDGEVVDVEISIPTDLMDGAPATIPMWHFDEVEGIWIEEGVADLMGDHYEASLAHFSFWNCDIPIDFIFLKGSIINRGIPIEGIKVGVFDLNNATSGYGITDENGMFCGFVPGGEDLTLIVYNQCGEEVYSLDFTTTDEDILLDPIELNLLAELIMVSGTVSHCDMELSELAYVKLEHGLQSLTFQIQDDGTFTGSIFQCSGIFPVIVSAYDPVLGLYSGEFSFDYEGTPLEIGNVEICDEILIQEYAIVEYNDLKLSRIIQEISGFNLYNDVLYYTVVPFPVPTDSVTFVSFNLIYNSGSAQFTDVDLNVTAAGFSASGDFNAEIIVHDGKEYIKSSGTLTTIEVKDAALYNEPVTSLYYEIVSKIKN